MRVLIRSVVLAVLALGMGLVLPRAVHAGLPHRSPTRAPSAGMRASGRTHRSPHHRDKRRTPAPIKLSVAAGYQESYRDSAWVPVRVTATNRTANTISGTVEVPDASSVNGYQGPPQPYRSLYQMPIVLPAGVTKQVTLFLPGSSLSASVDVQVRDAHHIYATASD
jgi:hypothetical protein